MTVHAPNRYDPFLFHPIQPNPCQIGLMTRYPVYDMHVQHEPLHNLRHRKHESLERLQDRPRLQLGLTQDLHGSRLRRLNRRTERYGAIESPTGKLRRL